MASATSALALKATAVVVLLAVLVLPSLGRCPSLGPEITPPPPPAPPAPSAPTPAPAPGPGPAQPISCSDCRSNCSSTCTGYSIPEECYPHCGGPGCDGCRTSVMQDCTAKCSTCDCSQDVFRSCGGPCSSSTSSCQPCRDEHAQSCRESCHRDCAGCV